MGRPCSHSRSMITASSSPNRRILHSRRSPPAARLPTITHRVSTRFSEQGDSLPCATGFRPAVNSTLLLPVIVDVPRNTDAPRSDLLDDADDAIRQLYSRHAEALHGYVRRFCPDGTSADDIVQETFIRPWRHLPQLRAAARPIRPRSFRRAR